jgi:hypothetical protein
MIPPYFINIAGFEINHPVFPRLLRLSANTKRIEKSTIDLPSAPDIFLKIIAQCSIDFLTKDAKIKCETCVPEA